MNDRFKYPINGSFQFPNLHPEENREQYLEEVIWVIPHELVMILVVFREQTTVTGQLRFESENNFRGFCCINFRNKNDGKKLGFETELRSAGTPLRHVLLWNKDFPISESVSELWSEENGWMEDGELTIEYGFQINSIIRDNIWNFNFSSGLFDSANKGNMITVINDEGEPNSEVFRCHRQLLEFHSPLFHTSSPGSHTMKLTGPVNSNHLVWSSPRFVRDDNVLQVAHGVQIKSWDIDSLYELHVAQFYQLKNVINYYEREVMKAVALKEDYILAYWIHHSSENNLRRLLAQCLKHTKYPSGFHRGVEQADLNKMSGEIMKQLVKYLFARK